MYVMLMVTEMLMKLLVLIVNRVLIGKWVAECVILEHVQNVSPYFQKKLNTNFRSEFLKTLFLRPQVSLFLEFGKIF